MRTWRQFPPIARDGWLFIAVAVVLLVAALRAGSTPLIVAVAFLLVMLVLLFRDPRRPLPSHPLAILAPVDGRITRIGPTDKGELEREAMMIEIKINHFGAYTARAPSEGKILSLRDNRTDGSRLTGASGLWIRTDEDDDVVVLMVGARRIAKPRCFIGYGERVGQGRRFGFIRLARRARVYMPLSSRMDVQIGDYVRAGTDVLATMVRRDTE